MVHKDFKRGNIVDMVDSWETNLGEGLESEN